MGLEVNPLAIVSSYLESFAGADPDTIASHVCEDFANVHRSALGDSCFGRASYRDRLPNFLRDFAGVGYELAEATVDGDRVAAAYVMRATYQGSAIEIHGMFNFVVEGGCIRRRVDYFDSLTFLQQIGQA